MQRRVPNAVGGSWPTLTVMGPITPKDQIGFGRDLYGDGGFITVSTDPNDISKYPDIMQSLRDPYTYPAELILYRDGSIAQYGPIVASQVQGHTITITCRGLLYYLRYMFITSDLSYTSTDQYTIIKNLINHHQNKTYGHFGIDASGVGTSGTNLTRNFKANRGPNVFMQLQEIAERENGFDYYYTFDANRDLVLASRRGSDKSGSVFLDSRGILSPQIGMSIAADEICTEALGVGRSFNNNTVFSSQNNASKMAAFGRAQRFESFDGENDSGHLNEYLNAMLESHGKMSFTPGAITMLPVRGADPIVDFDVGDTVTWYYDAGLGVQSMTLDVKYWSLSVSSDGQEEMNVEFV